MVIAVVEAITVEVLRAKIRVGTYCDIVAVFVVVCGGRIAVDENVEV